MEKDTVWMSDAPFEQEGTLNAVNLAKGDVLICGLGIGFLPTLLSKKKTVRKIDIVEANDEVVQLVFHQIKTEKMTIIKADAWEYFKTAHEKYDFIFVDIWEGVLAPIQDIERVREEAKRCLKSNGTIYCWLQELYDRIKSRLPKKPVRSSGIGLFDPCLICGKKLRNDYAGLCMDCADILGVSELFIEATP